jgi:glycosyltransferase involved in cell wall biosynthesis
MTFTGEIPNAKELLTALDIFCFTSVDEGLPNVIMEAAMAELPIVAWKYPFIEELVENGTMALLVDPEALVTFKEKIQILIESSELRYQLGNDAKHQMLNRFSLNRYIQNMTQVYLSILGNPYIKQK